MNVADLAEMEPEERDAVIAALTSEELVALEHHWPFWARPNQLPPPPRVVYDEHGIPYNKGQPIDWTYWLLMAGRGFGKTRVGAEWVNAKAKLGKGKGGVGGGIIHLIAPTNGDIRKVMLEGESGLLNIAPNHFRPKFEPSKMRVIWPNGVIAYLFSAEEPERLRGPQCGAFWADEIGAWARMQETWDQIQFGFRLGRHPQGVITTTPRPVSTVRELVAMEKDGTCVVTRGSTYDNKANLADAFFKKVVTAYEGTRLGRQELDGELLNDNPNALFFSKDFDAARVSEAPDDLIRVVVGVDPNVTANIKSDEAGIVTVGMKLIDDVKHFYILADDTIKPLGPKAWGTKAAAVYHRQKADRVVAETNNGGDLVVENIKNVDRNIKVVKANASRGKTRRAEPVGTACEQGRIHIVGNLKELEDQCCEWDPTIPDDKQKKSPDRMDAMVWAVTYLMDEKKRGFSQGAG